MALDPTSRISQYGHTVWRVQDGYFGSEPLAIAQTTDGYMWVGTRDGVFRFDGVRFVRWSTQSGEQLPSSIVFSLLGARDGSLWIGTDAGLAHLVNNHLITYAKNEGWSIGSIMEDKEGTIWITRIRLDDKTHPLCRVGDTGARCYGSKDGVVVFGAGPLAQDTWGNLWVGGDTTLLRWRPGTSKVYRPHSLQSNHGIDGVMALAPATDGSLWVGMGLAGRGAGLQHIVDGALKSFVAPKWNGETVAVNTLFRDHQDNLWVGTIAQGLYRVHGADVDHFGSADGLSSDYVERILEDVEGNLWVATSQGIDMFRDLRVRSVSKREGLTEDGVESVVASRDGTVWIGTSRLQVLGPHGISLGPGKALPGSQATSLFEDHADRLWAGMNNRLFVYERGGFRQITKQDGSALGMVMGITEDSEHNIWIETTGSSGTLVRIQDLKVRQEFPAPKVPLARKIVADPERGIWLGLVNGDLARYRDRQVNSFTFGDHPNSRVLAITAAADGSILGATAFGVIGWKNGRQQILSVRNGLPCNTVAALISDDAGNLWLHAQCGLIEIPKEQMQLWWEHSESRLKLRVFDASDGVQPGLGHFNTSTKTPDGRLWFANGNVLQVIDPAHIPENILAPPVHISALIADRKAYLLESAVRLPPLTRDLEIDYAALSYVVPQKVLFRYMLEGHDAGWQEPGTRRQAFYNDLRPGRYRFRLIACNNDGVWNEAGAFLDFFILPAFYQTTWFRVLCVVAFSALLWAIFQIRVRRLQRQFAIGLEARVNERTRIARDLHDTLLQSFQGLMLHFQTGIDLLPGRPAEARKTLEIAIDRADQAIAEGRDAVQGLRASTVETNDLDSAVRILAEELRAEGTNQNSALFEMEVEGTPRNLHPILRDEVYRITGEALRNAFRHAQAQRIEVEILYGERWLRLRVRDDGKGIDPKLLSGDGLAGHYGLHGMRERAKLVGGKLAVWSKLDSGTEVELSIPASTAYANPARHRSWLFEKLSGKGTDFKETDVKEIKTKS